MGNNVVLAESAAAVYEEPDTVIEQDTEPEDTEQKELVEEVEEEEIEAKKDEDEEPKLKVTVDDVKTAPMDYRFPTTNQAKHCYTRYNEYHKCIAEKGEDASECTKYAKYYRSLCPGEWVEKWNEQREAGTYAGRY
ncbi:cytochrome c oxidase subunit 6b [Marchantia polymorpha subsp. ruderalis]|uniref:Cytochrome c oxidase subunit n=2 Tax=Marchantia polymorpha TaxID=3197 RepID=A0AAF6B588_MARPO|nr:hypothetical protein MARPO_0098s0035 [Marchantia polymorpha]BBN07172.1 hypothetical protein Mp_4g01650 [Marchantia polymorpha subsp. ruderalis]|eukprot:PTQ32486.1 hypothetical protein MARPO_0098s0035 [Marchantia polymorpha]